jgi:hypothetical protein
MKTIQLHFLRAQLIYDIANNSYIEADVLQTNDEHVKHQIFDVAEKGNIDRVTRMLDLFFEECINTLYPYTKSAVLDQNNTTDELSEKTEYVITMNVPDEYSVTSQNYLEQLIHNLIVSEVTQDWMTMTNPNTARYAVWTDKIEGLKNKISGAMTKIYYSAKARIILHPF